MDGNRQKLLEFYEGFFVKLFFFVLSLSLFACLAVGQDKTEDHKKIIVEAYKKLETVSYRLKSKQDLSDGFSGISITKTCEFVSPDKFKKLVITDYWTDTEEAEPSTTEQIIEFEKKKFVKFDGENWTEMKVADEQRLKNPIDIYLQTKDFSYASGDLKIVRRKTLSDNQEIQIFKATYTKNKNDYEVFYSVDAKGFLIETEWKVVNQKRGRLQATLTETYEYDVNVKIEAPKLDSK